MKTRTCLTSLLAAITMTFGAATLAVADTAATTTSNLSPQTQQASTLPKNVELLFTQTADSAVLSQNPQKPQSYIFTLHNVNPSTVWFSDRPQRVSGTLTISEFMKYWTQPTPNNFVTDHPNANLIAVYKDKEINKHISGVLMLARPVYNAQQQTLTYDAYSLDKSFQNYPQTLTLHHVVLFIDSGPWSF